MRNKIMNKVIFVLVMLFANLLWAQGVTNPTLLTFTSVDWAQVDRHELDIVRTSDNVVVQTLTDNGPYTSQDISVGINVMPVAFGEYQFVARAYAGTLRSDDSDPSNLWDRVPGRPSRPDAQ